MAGGFWGVSCVAVQGPPTVACRRPSIPGPKPNYDVLHGWRWFPGLGREPSILWPQDFNVALAHLSLR